MSLKLALIYCSLLALTTLCGCINYGKMDRTTKIMVWYIGATCFFESLATGAGVWFEYNLIIYHFFSIIQLLLISLYFNAATTRFRKNRLIFRVGVIGTILGVLNSIFLQSPRDSLNTNFLVLESFLIIGMSLSCFYELLASDEININKKPSFWFSALFLVFWSFTFFYWLVGLTIKDEIPGRALWMEIMIWSINILTYAGFSIVFLSYKKMQIE